MLFLFVLAPVQLSLGRFCSGQQAHGVQEQNISVLFVFCEIPKKKAKSLGPGLKPSGATDFFIKRFVTPAKAGAHAVVK